jgi:hypothetical protein
MTTDVMTPHEESSVSPKRSRWFLVALVAVVLLVAAAAVTWVVRSSGDDDAVDAGVLVAARQEAKNFFTLDYRHPDEDVDRVLALATGTFKKEYASRRDEVVDGVKEKKLVVSADIPQDGVAVEFVDDDRARVLVAVDVTTETTAGAATENRYRTRVLLTRVGDRWLVSGLNQVG